MKIVRVKHDGIVNLYQTFCGLSAGDEVIVTTRRGGTTDGVVVSDSIYVPAIARVVLAYVLSTYRNRPLPWVLTKRVTKERMEAYEREVEEILGDAGADENSDDYRTYIELYGDGRY